MIKNSGKDILYALCKIRTATLFLTLAAMPDKKNPPRFRDEVDFLFLTD
jgi:hypothetical protein